MGRTRLGFCLVVVILTAAGVRSETRQPVVRIGVLSSLSDEWAAFGRNLVNGAQMAAEELNATGGINGSSVTFSVEDCQEANSGARAVSAYRSLRNRGIRYFIGPVGSPAGMALAPIVRADPTVLMISPSVGIGEFSEAAPNIFNSRGTDEEASRSSAEYAIAQGWKRAAILASQQPWESTQGRAFREEFERRAGSTVFYEEPLPETTDFKTIVSRMLAAKPDFVFLSNLNRMPAAARELATQRYRGPKLTTALDTSIIGQAAGGLEGALYFAFIGPEDGFSRRYQARFGEAPGFASDTAYDAMMALGLALRTSRNEESAALIKSLHAVRFNGAAGPFYFRPDRLPGRTLRQWKVVGNSAQPLQ